MKNKAQKYYEELHSISRKAQILAGVSSLISWDQETYMPEGAAGIRAEQLEALSGIIHEAKTSKQFSTALSKLIDINTGKILVNGLQENQISAVHAWLRDYKKEIALPKKFVEEFSKLTSEGIVAWAHAKKENSFQHFAPYLDRIIVMNQEKAKLLGFKDHPYDALLDSFEPGMTTREVDALFIKLKKFLTPLIKKIGSKKKCDDSFLFGKFPAEKQLQFGKKLLDSMNYDVNMGRLDLSNHPFSSAAHPTDSRITTRIHDSSLMSNISAILHEGGHALYEMGLPASDYGSPLCEATSLGIHESQSRFYETRIGLSKPFWKHFLPLLQKTFKGPLEKVTLDAFYNAINCVEPSLIRIEADEVTYNLHIILRFEIEKALIEGSLKVRDIPEAWNNKMTELLGVTPKNNKEGCLQDIHWSMGAFGYFPTYALGNIYASHLFEGFEKDNPDFEKLIESGNLEFIKEWLNSKVYKYGRQYNSKDLLEKATGKAVSADAFITYLTNKYNK
jgi:carboxypeptidase Taq